MITIEQIKAGRALINWSQQDLADQTGLSKTAIANVESGKHRPTEKNMHNIISSFDRNGIEFIDGGVRQKQNLIQVLEGEDCYLRFLDKAYYELKDKDSEILFTGSDERRSPPEVIEQFKRMRRAGIKMRSLILQGDTYVMGALEEYRWIPKQLFTTKDVKIVFGNSVAFLVSWSDTPKVIIVRDPYIAQDSARTFNYLWNRGEAPEVSIADERYE